MNIAYNTRKELPSEQLHKLFMSVGWSDGTETSFMLKNFNMPFINSTVVISAWENDRLVDCRYEQRWYSSWQSCDNFLFDDLQIAD